MWADRPLRCGQQAFAKSWIGTIPPFRVGSPDGRFAQSGRQFAGPEWRCLWSVGKSPFRSARWVARIPKTSRHAYLAPCCRGSALSIAT
jgi:hypothetical protein